MKINQSVNQSINQSITEEMAAANVVDDGAVDFAVSSETVLHQFYHFVYVAFAVQRFPVAVVDLSQSTAPVMSTTQCHK